MKLFTSDTSPYGRKVRILLAEKAMTGDVQVIDTSPLGGDTAALRAANPLSKIPALVRDDGEALFDSRVICEFLDTLGPGPRLLPAGAERFAVLRRQALADGVMDAAFNLVMEKRRPEGERSAEWMTRWRENILRATAAMEAPAAFDLGAIATAAALGYLEFRLPDIAWRAGAPEIAAWWDEARMRESVKATAPK
jgi:glutathione S-transferase